MTADTPDLTVAELEQIRDATLRAYMGGDEEYDTLPPHLRELTVPDGGLVNMIALAIRRTLQLEALRAETQQAYAAIHVKQQRDQARIAELEDIVVAGHAHQTVLGMTREQLDPSNSGKPSRAPANAGRTMAEAKQYRKKPVVIEAMQWNGGNARALTAWTGDAFYEADPGRPRRDR